MKAYDMVRWDAVIEVLKALNTPQHLVELISECITTPRFSVNFNGEQVGYFSSTNGLRQGDPLSPYLFALVMEIFNRIRDRFLKGYFIALSMFVTIYSFMYDHVL